MFVQMRKVRKNNIEKDLPLFLPSDNYSKSNPEGYVNLGTAVNGLCEGGIHNTRKDAFISSSLMS